MNKLTKTASTLRIIFTIAEKVLFALAIAAIVFIALITLGYVLNWSPDTIGTGYASLDIGFLDLEIAEGFSPDKWTVLLQVAITLTIVAISCVIGQRMIRCILAILDPISQGQPFHDTISTQLKSLAVLTLILGVTLNLFGIVEFVFTTFVYDLPGLLISEKITHVETNFTLDVSFLICSGILLLLSYIFRYGAELQQLSDETL